MAATEAIYHNIKSILSAMLPLWAKVDLLEAALLNGELQVVLKAQEDVFRHT